MYSEIFITRFKEFHRLYKTVTLIEDTIILNNNREEFFIIPTDLPLNKTVIYEKAEKEENHLLTIKRVNLSTLEYDYCKTVNGKKEIEIKGAADLESLFYDVGEAGKYKDENGNVYEMKTYFDDSEEDYWVDIVIGVGSDVDKSFFIYGRDPEWKAIRTPILLIRK
jgi:hypothetical protein